MKQTEGNLSTNTAVGRFVSLATSTKEEMTISWSELLKQAEEKAESHINTTQRAKQHSEHEADWLTYYNETCMCCFSLILDVSDHNHISDQ